MKRFFLSVVLAVVAGCGFAQETGSFIVEPADIKMLIQKTETPEWYQSMYEAWHNVALQNPKNAKAWLNCYRAAAYYCQFAKDADDSVAKNIVEEVKVNIPDTYEYDYVMYREATDAKDVMNYAEDALKKLPAQMTLFDYDTWFAYLMRYSYTDRATEWAKKYLASGLYPEVGLLYGENILNGMDQNAIYVGQSDFYVIPLWLLQYGRGEHLDKTVISLECAFDKMAWKKICGQLGVEIDDDEEQIYYDFAEDSHLNEIVEKTGRPLYCGQDNSMSMMPDGVVEGLIKRCDTDNPDYLKKFVSLFDKTYNYSFIRSGVSPSEMWDCEKSANRDFMWAIMQYVQPMRINYPDEYSRLMPRMKQAMINLELPEEDMMSVLNTITFELTDTADCYGYGMMYANNQDYENAAPLLEIAADKGHVDAMVALGDIYSEMTDNDSYAKAEKYYQKAIKAKNVEAMRGLGEMYLESDATEKKGVELLKKAGNLGNIDAMIVLVNYYNDDSKPSADEKESFAWAQKAAEAGSMDAQEYVGEMYANGEYVEKNIKEAKRNLEKAARQGSVNAMLSLGELYSSVEDGNTPDYREALHWYEMAAEQGDVEGYNNMAYIYANGQGVKKNMQKAFDLVDKGIEVASEDDEDGVDNGSIAHLLDTKGELYTMEGDDAKALECWKKVREQYADFYTENNTTLNEYIGEHHPLIDYEGDGWTITAPYDVVVDEASGNSFLCRKDEASMKIYYGKKSEEMASVNSADDMLNMFREAFESAGKKDDSEQINTNIGPNYDVDFLGLKCKGMNGVFMRDEELMKVKSICAYDPATDVCLIALYSYQNNEEGGALEDILNTLKLK